MIGLLDVNVLVALAWPTHIHHARAHEWFARSAPGRFATCPATQAGFLRVLSNPRFSPDALTPREALEQLTAIVAHPRHLFWADDTSLAGSRYLSPERIVGYRQVTDAHLLAVALRHRGALVTFDSGARSLIPTGFPEDVVAIPDSR